MPSVPTDLHGQDARATGTPPSLLQPIESLPGIGLNRARAFRSLGVTTLGELLDYFPRTYQFESSELAIDQLVANQIQTARGEVVAVDYIPSRPRPRFEATLDDGTGQLSLAWFHGAYLRTRIFPGQQIRVRGRVSFFKGIPRSRRQNGKSSTRRLEKIEDSKFRPIYPATLRLTSEVIARTIDEQLDSACEQIPEWFEVELLKKRSFLRRREAYRSIHRPRDWNDALRARRRIIYDELMLMQLGLEISRKLRDKSLKAPLFQIRQDAQRPHLPAFPIHSDRRAAGRRLGHCPRSDQRPADEPAPAGRCWQRQDRGRALRHAHCRRQRISGRDPRADRSACRAALLYAAKSAAGFEGERWHLHRPQQAEEKPRPSSPMERSTSPSGRRR